MSKLTNKANGKRLCESCDKPTVRLRKFEDGKMYPFCLACEKDGVEYIEVWAD